MAVMASFQILDKRNAVRLPMIDGCNVLLVILFVLQGDMATCYHRKVAWLTDKGLSFKPVKDAERVTVPCGKCVACRVNNAAQWATRIMHEAQYCDTGCFITLTYDPEHCPKDYCVSKKVLQKFMKDLRRQLDYHEFGHIRAFLGCGEYGTKFGRPHYHLLLLGWSPDDLVYHHDSYSGLPVYTSRIISDVWGNGYCMVGTLTAASSAYVARYAKKTSADDHVGKRTPPFTLASRNIPLSNDEQGACGAQWVLDHHQDLRLGYIPHPEKRGIKCRIPEYYFKLLERWYPDEYEQLKQYRFDYAMKCQDGLLLVEDSLSHLPSVMVQDDDNLIANLQKFTSSGCTDLAQLLAMATDAVRRASDAQDAQLKKLHRGVDKRDS